MTQEIIQMARDSGMELYGLGKDRARFVHHLETFANLVAAKALAQPEQEPEWYHGVDKHGCNRFYHKTEARTSEFNTPLYIHPPQRTEQERDEMLQAITDPENQPSQFGTVTLDYHFEKIKKWEDLFERMSNKVLAEQEPVAWMDADGNVSDNNDHKCFPIPLYTKEQP